MFFVGFFNIYQKQSHQQQIKQTQLSSLMELTSLIRNIVAQTINLCNSGLVQFHKAFQKIDIDDQSQEEYDQSDSKKEKLDKVEQKSNNGEQMLESQIKSFYINIRYAEEENQATKSSEDKMNEEKLINDDFQEKNDDQKSIKENEKDSQNQQNSHIQPATFVRNKNEKGIGMIINKKDGVGFIQRRKMYTEGSESNYQTNFNSSVNSRNQKRVIENEQNLSQTPLGIKKKTFSIKHKYKSDPHSIAMTPFRSGQPNNNHIFLTRNSVDEFQHQKQDKELNKRSQLRVLVARKQKLQNKMKKLQRELKVLSVKKMEQQLSKTPHKQRNLQKNFLKSIKMKKQSLNEVEKSRKAVQFVEKVSKQSLQRRIRHHEKINKMKFQRVSNQVSLCCSRTKCQTEVMQGQLKNEKY